MLARPIEWSFPGRVLLIVWALVLSLTTSAFCQTDNSSATKEPAEDVPLATRQEALSLRYQRFETTLLQLGEYLRKTDPDRAELLLRTLGKSKESRVSDQFIELVALLERGQLGDAIDGQETLHQQMALLLTLLQSEDRVGDLEKEQQRIQALIRDVDKLISKQTDARAATERGTPGSDGSGQQQKVADQTEQILGKIDQQDAERANGKKDESSGSGKPSDSASKPGDSGQKPEGDKPSGEENPQESPKGKDPSSKEPKPSDDPKKSEPMPSSPSDSPSGDKPSEPSESPSSPGSSKSPKSDKPSESSPSKSSPNGQSPMPESPSQDSPPSSPGDEKQDESPMDSGDASPSQERTPGREELQRAKQEMERAIKELQQKHREAASDRQDKALRELMAAKEKLEEILRQLREEEQELLLAALEARFRDMLARQINVHNGTLGLAAIPVDQRTDRQRSRAIELARNQDEVALLAAKALTLLKEEGSSIAFPEAVVQIRDDMLTSARRLERVEVDELTQTIQKDIIEALEEMLDALQKEMEKAKDKKDGQQAQQGQQQDPSLVDVLSELKMLRSLQYRVNRRTKQLGRLVDGEQAAEADVVQQLRELSIRQAKIFQTADDLAAGRNQ
ncbi:hypothetical protein GC163_22370 [bacterium]|nr:hypothetical protein [bacterium]